MIGKTLAHYEILEKIGAGGMGEVYRASDSKLGRDVALKILPPAFAEDPERLARFRREAQVLAQLNHPHIGAIYGFEETPEARALVLELVEGPTLHDVIGKGRVPLAEALPMARQIAEAVEAAHESGVVHRDLKPANVKLTANSQLKVLDFGLAKALEGDAPSPASGMDSPTISPTMQSPVTGALTGANVILGTAAYMSPEQARGQSVDKRADIWAFGVILFEMLTGRSLFAGPTVSDSLAAVLKTEPAWDALPAGTPPRIVRLLKRCLERESRNRLRDMGDARIVIAEAIDAPEEPASAVAAPPTRAGVPWLPVALLVAGLAAGAAIGWTLRPAPQPPAVQRFVIPSHIEGEEPKDPAISPDGQRIAYVLDDRLYLRDMDRVEPRVVPDSDDASAPFWSPDSRTVAYHADGRLWKVDAGGGRPTIVCDLEGMHEASWSGDEIALTAEGALQLVSARGGEVETVRELSRTEALDLHGVDHLPGGRGWIVVVHDPDHANGLEVWTREERNRVLSLEEAQVFHPRYVEPGYVVYHRMRNNKGVWAAPFSLSTLELSGDPFLVAPEARYPSISADGTLVCLPGENSEIRMVRIGPDGSLGEAVGQPQEDVWLPSLSPDGTKLLVAAEEDDEYDLWVHDIARATKTRLTFSKGIDAMGNWSPDGDTVYYSFPLFAPDQKIYSVAADGSGEPREVTEGNRISLSVDGEWLVFSRDAGEASFDLWKLRLAGEAEPDVFLATDADEDYPDLSPDGSWIAYQSDESGRSEVYVKPFPAGSGKWQVSVDGGNQPGWSPEGDRLFFVSENQLYFVEVETEGALRLSTPQQVVDGGEANLHLWKGYEVLPGRQHLIAVQEFTTDDDGQDRPEGILVTRNWLADF